MGLFGFFTDAEMKRVEEELKLLKEKKLHQDQARLVDYEKQFLFESDARLLAELHPIIKVMVRKTLVKAGQSGLKVGIDMGLRTWEKQDSLYHQGRKLEGGVWVPIDPIHKTGIVTNAIGGRSWHNYGVAVDIVMDGSPKPGLQPSWQARKDANQDGMDDWLQLGEIGESFGLTWGGRWEMPKAPNDPPHFQYHGDLGIDSAIALYKNGGIDAVWEKIT
jgi:peptidoglycan L-alanyl-D-glutamate endopeptidase CwlK